MIRVLLCASVALIVPAVAQEKPKELRFEKKLTLSVGSMERLTFESPLVEKGTVSLVSPNGPVNICIVRDVYEKAAVQAIKEGKSPKDVLALIEKTREKVIEFGPDKKVFT